MTGFRDNIGSSKLDDIVRLLSSVGISTEIVRRQDSSLGAVGYFVIEVTRGKFSFLVTMYKGTATTAVPTIRNRVIGCKTAYPNHQVLSRKCMDSREYYFKIKGYQRIRTLVESIEAIFYMLER